ncbi:MAG: DUF4340 domain-containing protein [Candidatus Eisenbacteria bacterium]|nr:DUF4340 domain-containing protein [Candidatus Eisenbacteria bacterium]
MRARTLLVLFGVLVVLVAAAMLFDSSRRRATTVSEKQLFPKLQVEQVDRIRIVSHDEASAATGKETILQKRGDGWVVETEGSHRAEPKFIDDILQRLPRFYYDNVVSENPEKQSLFHVDSTGIEVWITQKGTDVAHFFVGKGGPDFLSTYVRAAESNRVIQVPEYLPSLFTRGNSWRARQIVDIDPEQIRRIEYVSPSRGQLTLARDETGAWMIESPEKAPADPAKMKIALRSVANMRATDFGDDVTPEQAGVAADTTKIQITLADGSTQVVQVGGPAPRNQIYVRRQGTDEVMTLPKGQINTIFVSADFLKQASEVEPALK